MSSQDTGLELNAGSAEDSSSTMQQSALVQNQLLFDGASKATEFSNGHPLHEYGIILNNSENELSSDGVIKALVDHPIASSITSRVPVEAFSNVSDSGFINPPVRKDSISIKHQPHFIQTQLNYFIQPRIWQISDAGAFSDKRSVLEHSNSLENFSDQTLTNQNIVDVANKLLGTLNHESNLGIENPYFKSRRDENIDMVCENGLMPSGIEKDMQHGVQHLAASQLQKLSYQPMREEDIPLGASASNFGGVDETLQYRTHQYSSRNSALSRAIHGRKSKDNGLSWNMRNQAILMNDNLLDQDVNVVNQHLTTSGVDNSHFTSEMTADDIAKDYVKLYTSTRPENYDFALNIMAYVEFLNDNSWRATVSCFDENVKKVIKHIWNEQKADFDHRIDLRKHSREMILKLLYDLTQWSIEKNLDLSQLLNHSVIMCQIGVFARKHIFKTAPSYVIGQLRERVKLLKFENIVQFLFEIAVKDYSQKLVHHMRV